MITNCNSLKKSWYMPELSNTGLKRPSTLLLQTFPIGGICVGTMELLMTSSDKEVLVGAPPSNWQLIILSKLKVPEQPLQKNCHDSNHSKNHQACIRGSYRMTGNGRQPSVPTTAPTGTITPSRVCR